MKSPPSRPNEGQNFVFRAANDIPAVRIVNDADRILAVRRYRRCVNRLIKVSLSIERETGLASMVGMPTQADVHPFDSLYPASEPQVVSAAVTIERVNEKCSQGVLSTIPAQSFNRERNSIRAFFVLILFVSSAPSRSSIS